MIEKPLFTEGALLGPQHFHCLENYLLDQQNQLLKKLSPFQWGIDHIDIDSQALQQGVFRVNGFTARFENGLWVDLSQTDTGVLSLKLIDSRVVDQQENMTNNAINIYMLLPANQLATGINGYPSYQEQTTWCADYQQIQDQYDHSRECEVLFGRPNLQLKANINEQSETQWIQIARVYHQGRGHFELDRDFYPPLLQVKANQALFNRTQQLYDLIVAKQRVVQERRQQSQAGQLVATHDLIHFLLQQTLTKYQLLMDDLMAQQTHPRDLFKYLLALLGELSPFLEKDSFSSLPVFRQDKLGHILGDVLSKVELALTNCMPEQMATLQWRRESDMMYRVDHIDTQALKEQHFFLEVDYVCDDLHWVQQFEKQIKIGASTQIDAILSSALPGVAVTHLQRPPAKLPIKSGREYFQLETRGDFWYQVEDEQALSLFLPKQFKMQRYSCR